MNYPATGPCLDIVTKVGGPSRRRATSAAARAANVDGIQVDISSWSALTVGRTQAIHTEDLGSNVTALWLPRTPAGLLHSWRQDRLTDVAISLAKESLVPRLAVDRPVAAWPHGNDKRRSAPSAFFRRIRARLPATVRMTVALRPPHLLGGRSHLNDMLILRRLAEEWDLDIALDLSGPCDALWEVEAAIWRLAPRLQIIRFGPLNGASWHRTEPRLATRVLACLADLGYEGRLAIASASTGLTWWRQEKRIAETRTVAAIVRSRFYFHETRDRHGQDRQRFFSH